ncbi:alpha/beta hydrolase family protein [Calycomorphotria hydatis]|uniref:Alpha/beta hydrolase family protein n=1 Tax=Calycomorphotria hydatis TaxID=2528027 RepID=A0A517TD63_9PLAN|nr:hypothetical protein [Calycomorphotria hydatis]QDT66321.1 Alpha/beta hydrolase family protein [Calycomorphotria hydatis]
MTYSVFRQVALAAACLVFSLSTSCAEDSVAVKPLVLDRTGVMFVGGRQVPMTGGGRRGGEVQQTQIVEQAPVHYLIPPEQKSKGKLPVVMVPGMGLTSYIYLGTPDGRDGWATLFAREGYPVYVFDEPNNAVSGFNVSSINTVKAGQADVEELPRFMLWSNETIWRRWGIGPEVGKPFEDTRFPVSHIGQLYASMTPVYGTSRGSGSRGAGGGGVKAQALVELLEQIGPAILVLHSMSGQTGFEATRLRPDLVKSIVAVEVVGSPTDVGDIWDHFLDVHYIGVYGDHFDVRRMAGRHQASEKTAELIANSGGKSHMIWLPQKGIHGNTHLLMMDNNNDVIAKMIMECLADN